MPDSPSQQDDKLVGFREVHAALGSQCKTGYFARKLAERGLIRAVQLNPRLTRYSWRSVQDLIAGRRPDAK